MKNITTLYLLAVTSLAALSVGDRYDFICNDGQDIYNAELVVEDDLRYYVRLSPIMSRVPIDKKYVIKIVPRGEMAARSGRREQSFWLFTGLGAGFATGRLRSFSAYAPTGFAAATLGLTERVSAALRIDAEQYMSGGSYLRAFHLGFGGEMLLAAVFGGGGFHAGATGGGTLLVASSSVFSETSWVPSAIAWLRFSYPVRQTLEIFLTAGGRYIYDRETLILTPGVVFGVALRIFGT